MNDLDFRDARVLIIDDQEMNIAMLWGMLPKHVLPPTLLGQRSFRGDRDVSANSAPYLVSA